MNDPIIADIHRRLDALETVSAPARDEQSVQQPSELALSVPLLLEWFPVESAAEPRNQAAEAEDEGEESTEEVLAGAHLLSARAHPFTHQQVTSLQTLFHYLSLRV